MNEIQAKLLAAHNRHVRWNGVCYRIIACKLGSRVLADAEPVQGNRINLMKSRSELAGDIRSLVEKGLFV